MQLRFIRSGWAAAVTPGWRRLLLWLGVVVAGITLWRLDGFAWATQLFGTLSSSQAQRLATLSDLISLAIIALGVIKLLLGLKPQLTKPTHMLIEPRFVHVPAIEALVEVTIRALPRETVCRIPAPLAGGGPAKLNVKMELSGTTLPVERLDEYGFTITNTGQRDIQAMPVTVMLDLPLPTGSPNLSELYRPQLLVVQVVGPPDKVHDLLPKTMYDVADTWDLLKVGERLIVVAWVTIPPGCDAPIVFADVRAAGVTVRRNGEEVEAAAS